MKAYYRYTTESADGHFMTKDAQFSSDTEARASIFDWFVNKLDLIGITLYKYDQLDTCGSYHKIDQHYRPNVIFF